MRTIIIKGSPRENGDTSYIINKLTPLLIGSCKIISAYTANISPCIDCRHCHTHSNCVLNDDMLTLYKEIISADNIIIASPLYFSMLTGQLLSIASRFQYFFVSKHIRKDPLMEIKRKKGYLIITGGGTTKDTTAVIKTTKLILGQINASFEDVLTYIKTDSVSARISKDLNAEIIDFADKINKNFKI